MWLHLSNHPDQLILTKYQIYFATLDIVVQVINIRPEGSNYWGDLHKEITLETERVINCMKRIKAQKTVNKI